MTLTYSLRDLRQAAAALEQAVADEQPRRRLRRSVVRPLDRALAQLAGREAEPASDPGPAPPGDGRTSVPAADAALELARRATQPHVEHDAGLPLEVVEAVAALQDLALSLAPEDAGARRALFAGLQASLPSSIQTEADGPYLVTNPLHLRSWLGVEMATTPQMALCRCGRSERKPLCDGTHADGGFSDAKDPDRSRTGSTRNVGLQVTVGDNRGTCAHSGFCTDRLPTVFRGDADAFVAPSGGRMDEIIHAVQACPSGRSAWQSTSARFASRSTRSAHPPSRSPRTARTGSSEGFRCWTRRATRCPTTPARRSSTTASAAVGTPRTSRSAAGCTGRSSSMTPRSVTSRPCSSGLEGSRPCGG